MAATRISPMNSDEGYPISRRVDGVNVEECANHHGANVQFGKIRKDHREWRNSKTGNKMAKPEYAGDDYGPDFY